MNKQDITNLINSTIIDNDNGLITAETMRNVLNAINDYEPPIADELGRGDNAISQKTVTEEFDKVNTNIETLSTNVNSQVQELSDEVDSEITKLNQNVQDSLDSYFPINGGTMKGNIDMQGNKINNIGIEEVDKLPTENLYEGRMVRVKNKTYTFYNGLWLALSDDLRGHVNDTHEENFVYQPTASDLSIKDGFADIKKLKGNTVVWNQKFINKNSSNNGVNITTSEDVLILNGTLNTTYVGITNNINGAAKIPLNHIGYYRIIILKDDSNILQNKNFSLLNRNKSATITQNTAKFLYQNTNDRLGWGFGISSFSGGEVFEDVQIKVNVFDLTQMFGEGNEPATVEEFEAMFPKDYYEYNEGELMSFDGKGVMSVGFNAFDGEKAKVLKGQKYYLGGHYTSLAFKENKNSEAVAFELPSDRYYTPANNGYIVAEGAEICINLVHSGYRNGEYEKYEDYTLSFQDGNTISQLTGKLNGEGDSVVIFPDGLRSAGEAFDEIVYDEAIGKWKAVKRIGSVDMGTLNWLKNNMGYGDSVFILKSDQIDNINMARNANANSPSNMLSVNYYPSPTYSLVELDNAIAGPFSKSTFKGALMIKNTSYTDAESFKQSLQGQILYYELAEPEVYDLDFPINTSYEAYDFGTEEVLYNDDKEVNIPMKANIEYNFNAVDMIRSNFAEIKALKERVTALEQAILQIQAANTANEKIE